MTAELVRQSGGQDEGLLDSIVGPILSQADVRSILLSSSEEVRAVCYPAVVAQRFGDSKFRDQISNALQRLSPFGRELSPYKALEICHCLRLLQLTDQFPELPEYEKAQLVVSKYRYPPSPFSRNLMDHYALTHVIFFSTDFGSRPVPDLVKVEEIDRLILLLELSILRFLYESNIDLVVELLWCLNILNAGSSATCSYARAIVSAMISEYGYIPAIENGVIAKSFHAGYHQTLVAIGYYSQVKEPPSIATSLKKIRIGDLEEIGRSISEATKVGSAALNGETWSLEDAINQYSALGASPSTSVSSSFDGYAAASCHNSKKSKHLSGTV